MGKRELLIALAFIVVGVAAYQFTAPPPSSTDRGLSFSRIWNNARRGIRGNLAQATVTERGTIPIRSAQTELQLTGINHSVKIFGENRDDLAYELTVIAGGAPDETSARAAAKQTVLKQDDLGTILMLAVSDSRNGSPWTSVVLRVPMRLGVAITGGNGIEASNLGAARLDNVSGDSTVSHISGALTGTHGNGFLKVSDVGSVKMTLRRSRATFDGVRRGLILDVREGECRVANSSGAVELDESRTDVTIATHHGPIRVTGTEGRVNLVDPDDESHVDVHRAEIEVALSRAVSLTLLTTDDTLRLLLAGPPHVSIDAVANQGHVQAKDFGLQPDSVDQESRLAHAFGGDGGPRVSLRNLRGEIVIRNLPGPIVNEKRK